MGQCLAEEEAADPKATDWVDQRRLRTDQAGGCSPLMESRMPSTETRLLVGIATKCSDIQENIGTWRLEGAPPTSEPLP